MRHLILFGLLATCLCLESSKWYSVVKTDDHYTVLLGKNVEGSLAWGYYADDIHKDGWGKLTLESNSFKTNEEAFAAGYLEGALQVDYIHYVFEETGAPEQTTIDFLEKQYEYTQTQTLINAKHSKYWNTVGLFTSLLQGIIHGYNTHADEDKQLTVVDFLIMQAQGDLADLRKSMNPRQSEWLNLPNKEFRLQILLSNHCSVMLKIKDDLSDVFLGHNTWTAGQSMLRTYKFYNFGEDMIMQFSGYPGVIFSNDDYYLLQRSDQQLFVTETTNQVHDHEIFKYVNPLSLFSWQRAMISNILASNGQEWTEIFKAYNSGTYNNQYMVVDTKRFIPGVGAQPGFLWIVEQMPGLIINQDVTDVMINQGNYWPSYNIPYIKEIYIHSGQDKAAEKAGEEMTYEGAPRAKIMKREHIHIKSLEEYKRITRHNKYQSDEFSHGDPTKVLAARGDLYEDPDKISFFATDAKVTTYLRIVNENGLSDIQNGPTHDDQPIFRWSDYNFTAFHLGQPDVWNFDWISVRPQI